MDKDGAMSNNTARSRKPERRMRIRGMQDRERINVDKEDELRFWTREFDISEERLKEAIGAVGTLVNDVRAHLMHQVFRTSKPFPPRRAKPNR